MGFIPRGLSSSSKICQVEVDDDDCEDHWLLFDSCEEVFVGCEEALEGGKSSSPSRCVTKNKRNKIVGLRIYLDGDKRPRYDRLH